jgi:hypothetical protein
MRSHPKTLDPVSWWQTLALLLASAFVIALVYGYQSSRPAEPTTSPSPAPAGTAAGYGGAAGRSATTSSAPQAAPAGGIDSPLTARHGKAGYAVRSLGLHYLAIPEGPGVRVSICHEDRCITRVSTDAGPDKAMQRSGRVADVAIVDFRYLCRCDPAVVGLIDVTILYGAPSLPATDTAP